MYHQPSPGARPRRLRCCRGFENIPYHPPCNSTTELTRVIAPHLRAVSPGGECEYSIERFHNGVSAISRLHGHHTTAVDAEEVLLSAQVVHTCRQHPPKLTDKREGRGSADLCPATDHYKQQAPSRPRQKGCPQKQALYARQTASQPNPTSDTETPVQ